MVRKWCIWCEDGVIPNDSNYCWIHVKCADELMDLSQDIKAIKKILKGIHPRNEKTKNRVDAVLKYIADMEDFKRRFDNTMKLLKEAER